jgi:hypothetical protein
VFGADGEGQTLFIVRTLLPMVVSLAMLLTLATALAQAEPDVLDEGRCLLSQGCGMHGDGVLDLRAGQPVPGGEAGTVQYDNTA